jgi:hypothetical protein
MKSDMSMGDALFLYKIFFSYLNGFLWRCWVFLQDKKNMTVSESSMLPEYWYKLTQKQRSLPCQWHYSYLLYYYKLNHHVTPILLVASYFPYCINTFSILAGCHVTFVLSADASLSYNSILSANCRLSLLRIYLVIMLHLYFQLMPGYHFISILWANCFKFT